MKKLIFILPLLYYSCTGYYSGRTNTHMDNTFKINSKVSDIEKKCKKECKSHEGEVIKSSYEWCECMNVCLHEDQWYKSIIGDYYIKSPNFWDTEWIATTIKDGTLKITLSDCPEDSAKN